MASLYLSALKKAGLRDTQPRRMVLEILAHSPAPLCASAICDAIRTLGGAISPVTVYRILSTFTQLGIVHRHPCNGEFSLCAIPGRAGHHGFLHCTDCGCVSEFADPDLCKIEDRIAKRQNFRPTSHVSEIIGICSHCTP